MSKNQEMTKLREQILRLRSVGVTLGTAIHHFPSCGRPGSCIHECPEAQAVLQEIYESMYDLMLSLRVVYAATLKLSPKPWDALWKLADESTCIESDMADRAYAMYRDQDYLIRLCAEADNEKVQKLGTSFDMGEWAILTAEGAWQNGRRLPQIRHLLKYLQDEIEKQLDRLDSIVHSGLLEDCSLGKLAEKEVARA